MPQKKYPKRIIAIQLNISHNTVNRVINSFFDSYKIKETLINSPKQIRRKNFLFQGSKNTGLVRA